MVCQGGGVMVIKYTMSRGLYGGCGGSERGKEVNGDERHGIKSPLYLQEASMSPGRAI